MRAPALVGEGARPVACSLRSGLRQRRSGLGSLCGQCGQDGEGCAGQPRDSRGNRRCYIQGYNVEQTLQQLGGPLRGLRSLPSRATVCRVRSVWRKSGTIALARGRGVGASDQGLSASLAIIIRQWCRRPDGKKRGTRLKRLQSFLHVHPDVNRVVHTSLLCRWLRRLGLTRKKGTRVAKEQDPIKVSMFWTRCQILGLDPDATVWFDESGIDARDWRMERGYAPEGERFDTVESISRGHRIDALTSCDTSDAELFCVEFVHNGTDTIIVLHLVFDAIHQLVHAHVRELRAAPWHNADIIPLCTVAPDLVLDRNSKFHVV